MREKHETKQDITFFYSDDVVHNICNGSLAFDDGGETTAYNHRTTGHQICTVNFSCKTGKPLAIMDDKISCLYCEHTLTRVLSSGKRAHKIIQEDLSHPGKTITGIQNNFQLKQKN